MVANALEEQNQITNLKGVRSKTASVAQNNPYNQLNMQNLFKREINQHGIVHLGYETVIIIPPHRIQSAISI